MPTSAIADGSPKLLIDGQFSDFGGQRFCFRTDCGGCLFRELYDCTPTKTEVGVTNIRRGIIARDGFTIFAIDYSQIELRIAANMSGEPVWLNAYARGEDLHTNMAKILFHTQAPTKLQRAIAKTMNFSNLYGGSAFNLAKSANIPMSEAEDVWMSWWTSLPQLTSWVRANEDFALSQGYVSTFFGRVRILADQVKIVEGKGAVDERRQLAQRVAFVKRSATNSRVQGSAADVIKIAMVRLNDMIDEKGLYGYIHMLLQVHDELVFEMRTDLAEQLIPLTVDRMIFPVKGWPAQMQVDVEYGDSWDCKFEFAKDWAAQHGAPSIAAKDDRPPVITITVDLPEITQSFVSTLKASLLSAPGPSPVKLKFQNRENALPYRCNPLTLRDHLTKLVGLRIEIQG